LPEVIVYPTGGGTGLIGMWKGFLELRELGWLDSASLPRMVAVQSDGCAPIVRAFLAGSRFADPWQGAKSAAAGIRVPSAVGDFMILDAVRESGGCAVQVEDAKIGEWQRLAVRHTGLALCPEAGACVGAVIQLKERGLIQGKDRIVIFNTASAHKYDPAVPPELTVIDPAKPILPQL
jgi:threonine synthase